MENNLKIACSTVAFRQQSLEQALEIIRGIGFTRVETQSKGWWCPHADIDSDDPVKFVQTVKNAGIEEVVALHMYEGSIVGSDTFVSYTKRAVQWAKAAGVPVLITSEGIAPDSMSQEYANKLVRERLREAVEYATAYGISIAIETRGHLGDNVAQDFLRTMEAWEGKELGINFDSANVHACQVDETEILDMIAPRVTHFHAKDTHAGKCIALGQGDVNVGACMEKLHKMGYGGYVVLETEGDEPLEEMKQIVRESYLYLNKICTGWI